MRLKQKNANQGLSLVELMMGLSIFVVVVLAIGGAHQMVSRNMVSARLAQKAMEFTNAEIDRLNRMARIPERDQNENLVYRDSNNNIVSSGGQMVPYGYNNFLTQSALGPESGTVVTYPDAISEQLIGLERQERISMRRAFSVSVLNAGMENEFKEIVVTLSDANKSGRFRPVTQIVVIKKPHFNALDTRVAKGTAELTGRLFDKDTNQPILPVGAAIVTLTPGDGTSPRYVSTNHEGRFYFHPPLNTEVPYTIRFQQQNEYWTRTLPLTLKPGANAMTGDNGDIVMLDPIYQAEAKFTVRDYETNGALYNARVYVNHSGTVPNGYPATFTNQYTDASGQAGYTIKIPIPGEKTYEKYSFYALVKSGYVRYFPNGAVSLKLNKDNSFHANGWMVRQKYGELRVLVKTASGESHPKALVGVFHNTTYATKLGEGQTNAYGVVLISNIPINTTSTPLANSRNVAIRGIAAHHRWGTLNAIVQADATTDVTVVLPDHTLVWNAPEDSALYFPLGIRTKYAFSARYIGHDGPNGFDLAGTGDLSPFLNESVTKSGFPAKFTYSGYDPELIHFEVDPLRADTWYITPQKMGSTELTVDVLFQYHWNATPYELTLTRTHPLHVTGNAPLSVDIRPTDTIVPPNTTLTYQAYPDPVLFDLTYTWSVSGEGAVEFQPVDSFGNPVANRSYQAKNCRIKTNSQLDTTYVIAVSVESLTNNTQAGQTRTVLVNYQPLTVSITPPGPVQIIPGDSVTLKANVSGGSGQYQYLWSLIDPATGGMGSSAGTLSNFSQISTTFTSSAVITEVLVRLKLTDLYSNLSEEVDVLIQINPPGGIVQ